METYLEIMFYFLNDKRPSFIDFYYACDEVLVFDIAIAVNDWCIDVDGAINKIS